MKNGYLRAVVMGLRGNEGNGREMGYEPLDLTAWCNVDPGWGSRDQPPGEEEDAATGERFPRGSCTLRGLPFQIGPQDGGPCLLGFGADGYAEPVEIAIGRRARWAIVAHRLLGSRIREGEHAGQVIAVYRFRFANGEEEEVPVRERFEISAVPMPGWGQRPFLAVPDRQVQLAPRYEGRWDQMGLRLAEVDRPEPRWLVLWAWHNPHPELELASLSIEPRGRPFVVAALTLSVLEEDPFRLGPRRPVVISLRRPERPERPHPLSISIDRGVATYPMPLPSETEESLKASFPGWGQPHNDRSSPAYAGIAALPSATVRLEQGQDEIAAVRWRDVLENGAVETEEARLELVDRGKNWVRVTVLDDETGSPVPCRIHFRSPEGIPYQPHGHHNHLLSGMSTWHVDVGGDVRLGQLTYAYIDGRCQGWLPRGEVLVEVARGFEYEPLRTSVTIRPGQQELTLRLRRWADLNAERWFSGDSHVHFLSTTGALLEARGEDLNVVNLLQSQWGHLFTNSEDFLGRPFSAPDGRTVVYTSQENRQHMLGHLILLGLKEPVAPWCSDGPAEAALGGTLESTLCHWADECHRQRGTVVIPHFPEPNGEPAALIATHRADAVEMIQHDTYRHREYYRYLNGGYRLPLVGGTDKMTAEVPVGLYRTFVYIPPDEAFTYENWCKNLRLGRTFLSGGPILRFTVEGSRIGDTLHLPGQGGSVEIEAEAESIFPIHSLEIVQEGRVVASTAERGGTRRLQLRTRLDVDHHTWLAARVGGPNYDRPLTHHDVWRRGIMAHTSPIYVAVGEDWWMFSKDTAQYMLTLLHGGIEYIRQRSPQHPTGTVTHHHGEAVHLAYLERPFREAIEALRAREARYDGR